MKILTPLLLGVGMIMLTACATKSSSHSSKQKNSQERVVSKKGSQQSLEPSLHTCQLNQDTRKISVDSTQAGGCEVNYQKATGSKVIAEARNDLSYCGEIRDKVLGNLQEAGFQCQVQVAGSEDAGSNIH